MLKEIKAKWLLLACGLQFALIGGMFINAYLPIAFGTKVKVIAKGYDPRDLIAGNYVQLNYGAQFPVNSHLRDFQNGIFVCLQEAEPNLFVFKDVFPQPPQNKLCVKAEVLYYHHNNTPLTLKGIDKYFAPQKEAQKIQQLLSVPTNRAIVTLKIFQEKAKIVDLQIENLLENHH